MEFDYFIKIEENSISKVSTRQLSKIGRWLKVGDYTFRGWSVRSREEIEEYIETVLGVPEEDVQVYPANSGLHMIR